MKKIRIRDKEYNCSNKIYMHIIGLECENNCFNMEVKAHEQNEYELQQENKQLRKIIDKAIDFMENNWIKYKDIKDVNEELLVNLSGIKELFEILGDNK